MTTKPVKITDTTFRDGHQSILATRMRTKDILALVEDMDKEGLYSLEVWGGATFDVCTRFLGEDPWVRLRQIKEAAPNTQLQMLLRGQNLVGYRNYADDVVELFIEKSAEAGVDIFRVFDALNDPRNFETAFRAIKKAGKHIQAAISYSLTERRLGGDVFNLDYFVDKAKTFAKMGADSICVKDMAGLLSPADSYELISALKAELDLPIHLHSHYTSGMASMTYFKAIEAGVDGVDCSLSPFAMRTGQPALEAIVAALEGTERSTGLDLDSLIKMGQRLEKIAPRYRQFLDESKMSVLDTGVLKHQVPGGMLSNLVNQLKEANALDRLEEVYEELPLVRKDLGMCPLVTPTSQIVGTQAVYNVLFGRYKMISAQVQDYCYGLYGKPPRPINPELREKALKNYSRGQTPIKCRPGEILKPELEKARREIGDLAKTDEDLLTYTLYPTTGRRFLKWKYGVEEMPKEVGQTKSLTEAKKEDKLVSMIRTGALSGEPHMDLHQSHTIRISFEDYNYEVEVMQVGDRPVFATMMPPMMANAAAGIPTFNGQNAHEHEEEVKGTTLNAPMPGVIIRYEVKEGDIVKEGQTLVVLEAMKMENSLQAPCSGKVLKIHYRSGDNVEKDKPLVTIGEE